MCGQDLGSLFVYGSDIVVVAILTDRLLRAEVFQADASARSQKRGGASADDGTGHRKKSRQERGDNGSPTTQVPSEPKSINDIVTPLWQVPYEEQLQRKQEEMNRECITQMYNELSKHYRQRLQQAKQQPSKRFEVVMPDWLKKDSPLVSLEPIRASPITNGYRYVP